MKYRNDLLYLTTIVETVKDINPFPRIIISKTLKEQLLSKTDISTLHKEYIMDSEYSVFELMEVFKREIEIIKRL